MILHVYEAAKKNSEVFVATPDQKIIDVVNQNKGKAILHQLTIKLGQTEFMKFLKIT